MKGRPILFSAPMVRAILNGTKRQTRRVVKEPDNGSTTTVEPNDEWPLYYCDEIGTWHERPCPYGQAGDRLWVRETFAYDVSEMQPCDVNGNPTCCEAFRYRATCDVEEGPWSPSIHMPRRASRIDLEITDIRAERLQSIPDGDIHEEGVNCPIGYLDYEDTTEVARNFFRELWVSINGAGSWKANPWVWVVCFKRVKP
jgi:hypothetical protein